MEIYRLDFHHSIQDYKGVESMLGSILWAVVVILVVLWLIGFLAHVAGGFIHLLLIIALIVLLYNLFVGSRTRGV
jgi:Family of unknown function (DUF5670)